MYLQSLILAFVCFWFCEANSGFSASFYKNSNISTITETDSTADDSCFNSDILIWEDKVRAILKADTSGDSFVSSTRSGRRGRRKNPVMIKLKNKRRWRKLVNIKAETEYKIEIMNKLQTNVEVLLIVDFLNKSDCGVGTLFKPNSNISMFQHSTNSSQCYSVESSHEPRKRVMYPFLTPKCGCFTFRYHIAYREGNATIIRSPDPTSFKPHKKLTKKFCVQSEEDSDDGGLNFMKKKKHHRRRGKKGFLKKNRKMNRKQMSLELRNLESNSRKTLSRSKKDIFQIWEEQDRHATSTPPNLDINNEDNAKNLSKNSHEYEIVENEIDTDGIYENVLPEEDESEDHDDYENANEDKNIDEEEGNFIEDFGYEDENEDDERNFSDYENEVREENDSENDEEENEVNYDENNNEDDESNENDKNEPHQYDNINTTEANNLGDDKNYDNENDNQEEIDKNCDSDESDESSEESEDETEALNDGEEILEIKETKILEKNSINSSNADNDNRNHMQRRPRIRDKSYAIPYNNKIINHRHTFPRRRTQSFINRRKQNLPFTRTKPFKPWKESNRAKWQRKQKINVNNIKASRICCRQGINRKKLILHNKLENNLEFNRTCDDFPKKILSWVEKAFNSTEEFCHQKFSNCCIDWSLLFSNYRVPYNSMRNQLYM